MQASMVRWRQEGRGEQLGKQPSRICVDDDMTFHACHTMSTFIKAKLPESPRAPAAPNVDGGETAH